MPGEDLSQYLDLFGEKIEDNSETKDEPDEGGQDNNGLTNNSEIEDSKLETDPKDEGEESDEKDEDEKKPDGQEEKSNAAFAALRAEANKYKKFFKQMQDVSGLDETELMSKLTENAINEEAKRKNTDPEILKELQETKSRLDSYERNEKERVFMLALGEVQKEFSLDNKGVGEFVKGMLDKGIDPVGSPLDLKSLYKALNYDTLVKQATEKARQEILSRESNANKHASNPLDSQGKRDDSEGPKEITTYDDFNSLLNSLDKK